MKNKRILISGAGIGGLTLAYFLKKSGFEPSIIEKSDSIRDNGYMIDFFSSGISVSEKMGITDELKKKDIPFDLIRQFTDTGKKSMTLDMTNFRNSLKGKLFNFLRTDLVDVLYEKTKNEVDVRFGDSIKKILQTEHGVKVSFSDNNEEYFDLVIAADGLNSNVRSIVYSSSEVERKYLGYYVCALEHNIPMHVKRGEALSMICPQKQVMSYETDNGVSNSMFVFKSPVMKHMSLPEKIETLRTEFSSFVSPVPEIINEAGKRDKLFFDQVTQIRIDSGWHKGRVALVGDAAYCITLLSGQGASMAMAGAYVLSEKLKKYEGDYEKAFSEYESDLRPKIEKMQAKAVGNAATYLPANKISLLVRNVFAPLLFTKFFSPLVVRQLGAENYFKNEMQK